MKPEAKIYYRHNLDLNVVRGFDKLAQEVEKQTQESRNQRPPETKTVGHRPLMMAAVMWLGLA